MKRIVITGATGMIGSALVKYAIGNGIEVLCIVRKNSNRMCNIPDSNLIKILFFNSDEYCNLSVSENYDIFYHFAWENTSGISRDDVDIQTLNIKHTLDAVRLAKRLGCRKFIGAGSQAEYGIVSDSLKPETPVNPESGYGIAKYAAGKLSYILCSKLNIEFNWIRILSVFGPLDNINTVIMYTINELYAGRSPKFTKCEQFWDYLYCDDAARAFIAIGENGINGKIYPLGSGVCDKLHNYLICIRDIIAPDIELQFGKIDYYSHQPMYLCADISELTADTGWKPKFSFEEGIKKILIIDQ